MGKRELGGKLAALLAILTDAQKAGEKTLVFSRLVRLLVVIEAFLRVQYDTKFNVRMYYGGSELRLSAETCSHAPATLAALLAVGDDARERVVSDFNTGDANVLLGRPLEIVSWMTRLYCAPCLARSVAQGWWSRSEPHSCQPRR